jgi:dTDP-4-amino-4,6-dideoxygalactose transaminase
MDDDALWARAWSLKDHGKSYDRVFRANHPPGFRWLHDTVGTNWRMMSIQAVLGLRQLEMLHDWRQQRSRNAAIWMEALADLPMLSIPQLDPAHVHAWYRLYAYVRPELLPPGWTRDRFMAEINAAGVPCFSGSCSEIYLERAFSDNGLAPPERLPVARELGETSLAFLVDPSWSAEETATASATARAILLGAESERQAA